ncbi:MAG: hypothetical protein IRY99_20080, partial [Isosphaeraceae bacterium]|nr:hypothetical protein [Isosphaeraceae bacterium]
GAPMSSDDRTATATAEAPWIGPFDAGDPRINSQAQAVARRKAEWHSSLDPGNAFEVWLVTYIALQSVRLEHCALMADAQRQRRALRAKLVWDEDRRLAAELLGEKLSQHPARGVRQLRQTQQGAEWLLERWRFWVRALEIARDWDEPRRALAFDLLGVPPARRLTDPRLSGEAATLKALAEAQVAALERLISDRLERLDAAERAEAEAGRGFDDAAEARRLRRYESECRRAMQWALSQIRERALTRRSASASAATATPPPSAAAPPSPPPSAAAPPSPPPSAAGAEAALSPLAAEEAVLAVSITRPAPGAEERPLSRHARRALAKRQRRQRR